ncbi:flagellar type III secretion system pore protein FliP [Thalassomonas actiniarum]|uniref:Flagellar biosynthetic protein FliP n=1 Tax=Thalassomonas actiniarum TaxID=485447 RepID=A0AAF0C1T5_9GAMM|nr:flagellar type III secretion system pore protein FliP [Thalassomonas actiniarum]WDD99351.1 flagellar type III secretion system pore protein FliP [Thalassomonas actiniarum]
MIWRFLLLAVLMAGSIFPAQAELTLFSVTEGGVKQEYSIKLQILLLMTALSLLPAMVLMLTSFTRIIVVLAILRQAMGLQQSPPNRVLVGIALTLTILIMKPVWSEIHQQAFIPYDQEEIGLEQAIEKAKQPLQAFMLAQTRETDLEQMMKIADEPPVTSADNIPFFVLMPAFVLSELKTAFQIGFMLFIPFLVIDLVVASVLMAMGMMMLSPLIISLPFKLMVFVLVDGWSMTVGTLAASFGGG